MEFMDCLQVVEKKLNINFKWKENQLVALEAIFNKKDMMVTLPTGYGKSILYQAAPYLSAVKNGEDVDKTQQCVLVITPLNAIMLDQVKALSLTNLRACAMNYDAKSASTFDDELEETLVATVPISDIKDGGYNIIYAHPESLLSTKAGRELLMSIRHHVCALAIDEAHIILEW
jgi:ATP-dependent DNA helicase RecQ